MIYGPLTHPGLLCALATSGHGTKILLADGNYPHTTGVGERCQLISLNLAPGLLDVDQVLAVLKETVPIERAEVMVPESSGEPVVIPAQIGFREALPGIEFSELSRWNFYDAARSADVGIIIATGDQRLYANLLLTIGVRVAGE